MVPKQNLLIIKQKPNNCQKYAPRLGILLKCWEKGGTSGSLIYVVSERLDLAAARSRAYLPDHELFWRVPVHRVAGPSSLPRPSAAQYTR